MRGRIAFPLRTAEKQAGYHGFGSDDFARTELPTSESELEKRRSDLRNGLTDKQRLFLFGKLSGLNDKDAALAAGYSRVWPRTRSSESGSRKYSRRLRFRAATVPPCIAILSLGAKRLPLKNKSSNGPIELNHQFHRERLRLDGYLVKPARFPLRELYEAERRKTRKEGVDAVVALTTPQSGNT